MLKANTQAGDCPFFARLFQELNAKCGIRIRQKISVKYELRAQALGVEHYVLSFLGIFRNSLIKNYINSNFISHIVVYIRT